MAENEPDRKDFKKERQTEETTREVKITEKQAQKESAKSLTRKGRCPYRVQTVHDQRTAVTLMPGGRVPLTHRGTLLPCKQTLNTILMIPISLCYLCY